MSKKSRRIIVSVVSLIVVAAIVVVGLKVLAARKTAAALAARRTGVSSMYVVAPQDVSTLTTVSGTVAPLRSATLTAQAQGTITGVYKKEGDSVKAGDVIVSIDSAARDNQLAQAESNYQTSLLNIETANTTDLAASKIQLETALKQAQIQELQAENNLKNATVDDTSSGTVTSLQEAVTKSEESLTTAQANLKYLQDYDTSSVAQSDIAVQQAQLTLTAAENQLVLDAQAIPAKDTTADLAKVDSARLSLESANASAEANKTTAEASVAQRILNLNAAQLQVTQAERAVTTAKNNLAANQKTVDSQANNVDVLKANVDQAKAGVTLAQSNLAGFSETARKAALQLQLLQQQKNQAELSLQATQLTSDNYVVKAPWDGVITSLNVRVGDQATSATSATTATTATVIADTSGWNVQAYVDELDVLHVKAGQDASVTMDAYPNQTFKAKITYVGTTLVATSSSVNAYAIKIQFTNPPTTLVAGMTADASITTSSAKGVLAVPVESILSENGKNYVTVISVDASNKRTTTRTEVKTGIEGDVYVQIISGLKAGDRILRTASATTTTSSSTSSSSTTTGTGRGSFGGLPGGL
ncbi:efflux RND transporter periplasmic adaptor subunit [Candidatus Cryosericum hinesii]|jgi:multidrug efflux pump subunit AcrA (membrane-fusion protein)|uniref:Efflux RND transporter periplasmic adaptor subunit n=2 Tax=Candidatus Cryosericum hinesii TaxID=2290915 RepID=A0ABX9MG99_9BACT|nr:efflux RND transporter periplasmic adaptor subunit [Candidatus Cryosericum hinesii]RIE15357.1 efflux RND transporter periplasmic adaptor subunit [Candidatus Cryosericum hinesii]